MKILCFGDSNTYGYDPRSCFGGRYPKQHRWVDLLSKALVCDIINAGENGCEIPWREGECTRFNRILDDHSPVDFLVIMLGTNDLLQGNSIETVQKRMEGFLTCIDQEKVTVLLVGPPPMKRGEWVPTQRMVDTSIRLNREYQDLCKRLGVCFVDTSEWDIPVTFDGVHFAEEGHSVFAERLTNYLKENVLCLKLE